MLEVNNNLKNHVIHNQAISPGDLEVNINKGLGIQDSAQQLQQMRKTHDQDTEPQNQVRDHVISQLDWDLLWNDNITGEVTWQ